MNVELVGQHLCDTGNADVPGDMADKLVLRKAEIAERARNQPAVMIAGEEEGRLPRRVIFVHRRNIRLRQK